jgi:hypothetical protein
MFNWLYLQISLDHIAMIEWKECEHEFDDIASLQIPQAREAL